MKRITAEDHYPMRVNPSNFTRNDVVKKIYMDNITTPYVGVVTAVIPSTNKVQVQWPYGTGLEDPWDLIKVNPILNPPTVREDKSYKTYQNQKAQKYNEDYIKRINHHNVLNDFLSENVSPIIVRMSSFYNEGLSKKEAYTASQKIFENHEIVMNALNRVYNDSINIKRANLVNVEGEAKEVSLAMNGNSDQGYKVSYALGKDKEEYSYNTYRKAFDSFVRFENIITSLDSDISNEKIVYKVANSSDMVRKHIKNAKLSDLDEVSFTPKE